MEVPPIREMEKVVASVSVYKGTHRFDLIKLISRSGASYVGVLSPSTTHLVCWEFQGEKYKLARRLGITVVNHRWVEDCVVHGKRLPEYPYTLQSGKEVGQLRVEIPVVDSLGSLNKKCKVLSDKSNVCCHYDTQIDQGDSDLNGWTCSTLLKQDLVSDVSERKDACRSKLYQKKVSKIKDPSSCKFLSEDIPVSKLLQLEHENTDSGSAVRSVRGKRKISRSDKLNLDSYVSRSSEKTKLSGNIEITSVPESSHRPRRLTSKTISQDHLEMVVLDSDDEWEPIRLNVMNDRTAASCQLGDRETGSDILEIGMPVDASLNNGMGSRNGGNDADEEMTECYNAPANLNRNPEDLEPAIEFIDTCAAIESSKEKITEAVEPEPSTRSPSSTGLSCVICWTEFSQTRGILPCGHRFCYSCIENWANQMTSKRKIATCPLCKASFMSIKKVEGADTVDQKIYSQSIPSYAYWTDALLPMDHGRNHFGSENQHRQVCSGCHHREPEDLLISCELCGSKCIHMYCLDPFRLPWVCVLCKDLGMLYRHNR